MTRRRIRFARSVEDAVVDVELFTFAPTSRLFPTLFADSLCLSVKTIILVTYANQRLGLIIDWPHREQEFLPIGSDTRMRDC